MKLIERDMAPIPSVVVIEKAAERGKLDPETVISGFAILLDAPAADRVASVVVDYITKSPPVDRAGRRPGT
ncbi:MAG: hypothetical protein ACREVN_09490 [Gammaproteobacteria bacterium]